MVTKQINELPSDDKEEVDGKEGEKQEKIKVKANLIEIVEKITTYVIQFFFMFIEKPKVINMVKFRWLILF